MDNIEGSGQAVEGKVDDLAEAQKQLGDLNRPFGVTDVVKTLLWTLIVFALFRFSLFILMDKESKRQLFNTMGFNIAVMVPSLLVGMMLHSSSKRDKIKRLKEKLKLLTPDDGFPLKPERVGEIPPRGEQVERQTGMRFKLVGVILLLVATLMFVGFVIVGIVAATVDLFDPDILKKYAFFQNDTVQFFLSLFQVVGFFGAVFLVIFALVIGGHAAVSKDPIEKNLSEEMLKKRFKNALVYTILLLILRFWGEYELKKFRDWWHKKS